jgi:hypothetical protein
MAYLAVINGARGILFFQYAGEGTHEPVNWEGLKRLAAELKKVSPILLGQALHLPVSLDVEPLHYSGGVNTARMEYTLRTDRRGIYLIAANNWPGPCRVTFTFGEELRSPVRVRFEKRRIRANARSFSDTFAEYDVHVYELNFDESPAHK